jgi:hypothetical protein
MDKGTFSNLVSAAVTGAGLLLPAGTARDLVLSVGLFALSGGVTNALAVKMLFDRIPGLIGSGVIPARFQEIREKVRSVILEHFFDEAHLGRFLEKHRGELDWKKYVRQAGDGRDPVRGIIEKHWDALVSPERLQPFVDAEVEKLLDSKIGGLLIMVGVDTVKPAVRQFVSSFAAQMKGQVIELASKAEPGTMRRPRPGRGPPRGEAPRARCPRGEEDGRGRDPEPPRLARGLGQRARGSPRHRGVPDRPQVRVRRTPSCARLPAASHLFP